MCDHQVAGNFEPVLWAELDVDKDDVRLDCGRQLQGHRV
jgi:hypothetical protein